ncbi:hypothetical protein FE394_13285, partial [Xenorhabdus sp. Reich]
MSSYISRAIVIFSVLYTLMIPSTVTNAFADDNPTGKSPFSQQIDNKADTFKKKDNNTLNNKTENLIANNIRTVSKILSFSPSELTEQAKSYALGKVNSTVTSEVQKWLSQFGTTRINFGLDKKGTLENTSVDLLLPIYDNKTDWLLFSQLGYRNKDSRNTINVGLGGRYFYQNWMYGLNTFYDRDLTGKNQRLGLGGEIWADYIKLSANAYYGLNDWRKSQHFQDYYERPANGYDINGEFFLPVYPNLGAKLAYEQYFGDNVTLFNRDTKQKNPSLAKLGLTYTPAPLFTMGIDYKQGESGHTETQFLASLNYKLGVPLNVQLSPENVASMRTLEGSRYDLVERNNNIILDHKKRPTLQLSLPSVITGYTHKEQVISVNSDPNYKIEWLKNNAFIQNGGEITLNAENKIIIIFPEYLLNPEAINTYPLNFKVFENGNPQQTHNTTMEAIVRPFFIKEKEVKPEGIIIIADNKTPYIFTPVITYDTVNNKPLPPNVLMSNIEWTTEPPIGEESGLNWVKSGQTLITNEKGQLQAELVSAKPQKNVKVFLQMDGLARTQVGTVSFGDSSASYHIQDRLAVNTQGPLIANGHDDYTFTGVVYDAQNNPVRNKIISQVKWGIKQNGQDESQNKDLVFKSQGDTTNGDGELTATLASHRAIKGLQISLSIKGDAPVDAAHSVSFTADTSKYHIQNKVLFVDPKGSLMANDPTPFTYAAVVVDGDGSVLGNTEIKNVKWKITQNG